MHAAKFAGAFYFGAFAARFKSLRQNKNKKKYEKKQNTHKKINEIEMVSSQMFCIQPRKYDLLHWNLVHSPEHFFVGNEMKE